MPSILIVDDDVDLSAIVARYLESEGFAVERAVSAEEAYDVLATRAFDLVLLDINLPGDDGFAACAALRRASNVPIGRCGRRARARPTASSGSTRAGTTTCRSPTRCASSWPT